MYDGSTESIHLPGDCDATKENNDEQLFMELRDEYFYTKMDLKEIF